MRKSTKLALAFAGLAGAVATVAFAAEGPGKGMHRGMMFQKADADHSGDISFDEFSNAMGQRLGKPDADGKITVEELAGRLEKARFERMAKRMIARFDTNGDGVLTADEIQGKQKKIFAMLDKNDDGKIEKDELPHRPWGGGWRRHHSGGDMQ